VKVGPLLGPIPVISGCCAGVATEKSKQKQTTAVPISFVGQDNTNGIAFVISVLLKLNVIIRMPRRVSEQTVN
jgi:hypothetical protein